MSVMPAPTRSDAPVWYEPSTMDQALKLADYLSRSQFCPDTFRGKPADVLCAIMYGATVGMSPTQALQGVAVVRGKPSLFGDSLLAVCRVHPEFEDIRETIAEDGQSATCEVKRKGQSWHRATFGVDDAKRANLWGQKGPWSQYPKRMLQMRARGFALRDTFADALAGLISFEEAQDMPQERPADVTVRDTAPATNGQHSPAQEPQSASDEVLAQVKARRAPEPDPAAEEVKAAEAMVREAFPDPGEAEPAMDLRTKDGVANQIRSIFQAQGWDAKATMADLVFQAGIEQEFGKLTELPIADLRKILAECEDRQKAERDGVDV